METEKKAVLGIVFLFTLITGVLSFVGKLSIIFMSDSLNEGLSLFFRRNSLWIIFMAGIIIVSYNFSKKSNQNIYAMLSDRTIRMTTGVLVIIDGLIDSASLLPVNIMSIKSAIDVSKQAGLSVAGIITKSIITNSISLIMLLVQIIFGIYILRCHIKQKK
jgi:hypothetical protein